MNQIDTALPRFGFDNSFVRDLPGAFAAQAPERAPQPRLVLFNDALAHELGLDAAALRPVAAEVFSGNRLPEGAEPVAQAYAGHQFGGFSPQLGDGRALLLGEVIDIHGKRRDIALKGSGRTPFSRRGDGLAALGPVLREYLMGEAMHALGIPTTRALAAVTTGRQILRDRAQPGAVLTRVAASHLRVGTFQFFAARGQTDQLRALVAHALPRHHPQAAAAENPALALLDAVIAVQARLVAGWMGVGFVHGVMNTDNMTISGETIDYGPCAFLDAYSPGAVFSSIDQQGRYAFGNQPLILGWNLARLAEALLPLLDADADRAVDLANDRLETISGRYRAEWLAVMRMKLGLAGEDADDGPIADNFMAALVGHDFTMAFAALADAVQDPARLRAIFADAPALADWLPRWRARLAADAPARLRAANPVYIPRNHLVEEALSAAMAGDLAPFEQLLAVLRAPFTPRPGLDRFALPAPAGFTDGYRTFCGT